jgi:RNA polymerase sigma factor (sigma-70 family)
LSYNDGSGALQESKSVFDMAVSGDTAALHELFAPCMPQLQRTATRLLSNPQDSEDALQDGLLSALRYLNKFQGRAQFSTWMHTIVVNAAKSILRKQRRRPLIFSLDEPHPEHEELRLSDMLADSQPGVEDRYAKLERSHFLARILQQLPPMHRSIIWLCDVQELSMQEAAHRLGLTVSAAKTRHLRANRFLLNGVKQAREQQVPIESILAKQSAAMGRQSPATKMNPLGETTPRRKRHWANSCSASNNVTDSSGVMERSKRIPPAGMSLSSGRQ